MSKKGFTALIIILLILSLSGCTQNERLQFGLLYDSNTKKLSNMVEKVPVGSQIYGLYKNSKPFKDVYINSIIYRKGQTKNSAFAGSSIKVSSTDKLVVIPFTVNEVGECTIEISTSEGNLLCRKDFSVVPINKK